MFLVVVAMFLFSLNIANAQTSETGKDFSSEIISPEGGLSCNVQFANNRLSATVTLKNIDYKTVRMNLGVQTNKGTLGTSSDSFVEARTVQYDGVITSAIAVRWCCLLQTPTTLHTM